MGISYISSCTRGLPSLGYAVIIRVVVYHRGVLQLWGAPIVVSIFFSIVPIYPQYDPSITLKSKDAKLI